MLLTRETLLEEDFLSEDFESDFEREYSRAQKEFTREVRRKQMVWLVRGLIFGSLVNSAIAVPMALLSVQKSPRDGLKRIMPSDPLKEALDSSSGVLMIQNGGDVLAKPGDSVHLLCTVNSTFESCKWFNPEHQSCEFEWVREMERIVRRDCEIAEKVNSLRGRKILGTQIQSKLCNSMENRMAESVDS